MHKTEIKRAPISAFQNIRNVILFGEALKDVRQIERSIAEFGMIMPIIVTGTNNSLMVIDGKKRLTALKRMAFAGTLPRSLVKIPYLFLDEAQKFGRRPLSILPSPEIYKSVEKLKFEGDSVTNIARKLYLCRRSVQEMLHLTHLCDVIKKAFFRQSISFEQAHAFSTMPCKATQNRIFFMLGPFAEVPEILEALKADTLLQNANISDAIVMKKDILPSPQNPAQIFRLDRAA